MKASFIPVSPDSDFPIQNLPYGVFEENKQTHVGVAIGEQILSLTLLESNNLLGEPLNLFSGESLNPFMAAGKQTWDRIRTKITKLLDSENPELRDHQSLRDKVFFDQSQVKMLLPAKVGDFTDFYASREHATNVGKMFRDPDKALLPNWLHLPVGYHGRASSVVIDGTPIRRPKGQLKEPDQEDPHFGPTRCLDFELEMGIFLGPGNKLGEPIPIDQARDHIFGLVLLNDWSARDIQRWEYLPLGPFLAKNFATTISPWIVPYAALEPFLIEAVPQEKQVLPYLNEHSRKIFDIQLSVELQGNDIPSPQTICQSNFKHLYWTPEQFIAHHSATGCNLQPGDLLGTGTISGPTTDSLGSLLELAWGGKKPLTLDGAERTYLQDGDHVTLKAQCHGNGYKIGFGPCTGQILPLQS